MRITEKTGDFVQDSKNRETVVMNLRHKQFCTSSAYCAFTVLFRGILRKYIFKMCADSKIGFLILLPRSASVPLSLGVFFMYY
jgi:hypothetical protein